MTLATIARKALRGLSGFKEPASFYNNPDLTATLVVALADEGGQDLEKMYRWQELITEYTFTTVNGTEAYALPTDFRAFANMSQWDRANQWRMIGPTPSFVFQWLKSGISVWASNNRWFAVRGNRFAIYPTLTVDGDTISFDYYSKNWVTKQVDNTTANAWSADLDTARLD